MGCSFLAPVQDAIGNVVDAVKPILLPVAAVAAAVFAPELLAAMGTVGGATAATDVALAEGMGLTGAVTSGAAYDVAMAEAAAAGSVGAGASMIDSAAAAQAAANGAFIPEAVGSGAGLNPAFDTLGNPLATGTPASANLAGLAPGVGTGAGATGALAPATVGQGGTLAAVGPAGTGAMAAGLGGGATDAAGNLIGTGTAAEGAAAMGSGTSIPNVGNALSQIGSGVQPLLSTLGSLYTGQNSADAIAKATDQLLAGGTAATGTIKQYLDPYITAGQPALQRYAAGVAPGGEFASTFTMADAQNTPAMQTAQAQGQDIIQNSAAAKGGLLGTNAMADLTKFGQKNATQYENQAFNEWLANRNANQNALTGMVNLGSGASNTAATDISKIQEDMANALATGTIGQNNAKNVGTTGAINTVGGALTGVGNIISGGTSLYNALNP